MATITVYPSGYVSDDYSYKSIKNIDRGYASANSNFLYAEIEGNSGIGAETYFYYTFDLSELPPDVVITSVTCLAAASRGFGFETSTVQLYSGTNAKGSAAAMGEKVSIESGTWTREELNDCRLKLYAKSGTENGASLNIKFYGATLTIEYAEAASVPIIGNATIEGAAKELVGGYCNIGGVWKEIAESYVNVDGVWKPTHNIS